MIDIFTVKDGVIDYFQHRFKRRLKLPKTGVYYPSMLGISCVKAQWNYYKMTQGKKTVDDSTILRTSEGSVWHEIIQSFSHWDGIEVPCRKKVRASDGKSIWLRGYADAVKGDCVYEFKRTSYVPRKPRFEHILQLNYYMKCLGKPKGILVYIGADRGVFDVVEHIVDYSDWHQTHLINRALTLHTLLVHNEEPECSCKSHIHDTEWRRFLRSQK